jgi:cytoskeleton protein RodZ
MRGVSLAEISAATRISIRFLEAIEAEELSKLPGGIFTRSFVRTYAKYLGLDEERVLADCQLAGKQRPEVDIRRITANRARTDGRATRTRLIGLLVAGVLLAGGYALFHHSRRIREQGSSTPIVTAPSSRAPAISPPSNVTSGTNPPAGVAPGQSSTPTQPASNPTQTGTSAPSATASTAPGTPPSGSPVPSVRAKPVEQGANSEAPSAIAAVSDLNLQVAATDRSWVAVDSDGKTVLQKVLNPNEVENLKAHDSFDVTVGNAQGVVLTLNGETLKPLGRKGEVKSIHLTREDLKNSTVGR